jgi:hypothetical protein
VETQKAAGDGRAGLLAPPKTEKGPKLMSVSVRKILLAGAILLWPVVGYAQPLPTREGTCARTRIAELEQRLRDGPSGPFIAGSGSAIGFTNGGYQVGYSELEQVRNSRAGDPVLICLVRIPAGCPRGDVRGRLYTTTNLRTLESWTLPDSEHECGGA